MKNLQYLSAMAIITIVMVLIYAGIQQTYRSNANDPQVEIAYDLRDRLQKSKPILFDDTVELESSLSVFKELYDGNGNPIQSNGLLNGKLPQLPKALFEYAKTNGEHWITWQPQRNVRMAVGIVKVNSDNTGYIVVGRSLKEVEERVSRLTTIVIIAWILCIAIVVVNWIVGYQKNRQ